VGVRRSTTIWRRADEPERNITHMLPHLLGIDWLDPEWLINWFGPFVLLGVAAIVFIETGFIVLSFLPGDSLLFTVGLLTATGVIGFPVWVTMLVIFIAAFAGDQLAFYIGRKAGPAVFNRKQSRFFNPENVERTNAFFEKYGGKAVIMARFLPVFRAFVPLAAGVGRMKYRTFISFNVIGAFLWGVGLTAIGFFLGQIDFVADYAEYFIIAIVLLSGIPILIELAKAGRTNLANRRQAATVDRIADVVPNQEAGN
jgi:membrane-associated protein